MITDMGGFAGATFKRGLRTVNIPTTLMASVDAAVGGKTGVNFNGLKNEVGSFYPPECVFIDCEFLRTIDRDNLLSGYAEMIKHALIGSMDIYASVLLFDLDAKIDYAFLNRMVAQSVAVKERIVEEDPKEHGIRKALNFGHTIGHGIEAVKGIKGRRTTGLFHGECVALGMLPMIESKALQKRVRNVYRRLGLPTRTAYDKEKVLAEMLHDKKAQDGQITIIKVPGLGCWRAETIPVEGLRPLLGMED